MKVNVKLARQKKAEATVNEQESAAISFALAIACEYLHSPSDPKKRFGQKRLNAMIHGMYAELQEQFQHYRSDDEKEFSASSVPFLYVGLRNQVAALEVDVGRIESTYPFRLSGDGWGKKAKREVRYELLQNREKMFRSLWYALMLYLWREHGFGAERLTRFYQHVRYQYCTVFTHYLDCTPEWDTRIQKTMRGTIERVQKLGVEI